MKILIADDHDLVRDTIAAFLAAECARTVVTAGTLDDALAAVKRDGAFDLDGLGGLTRMIAANDTRPVAILSGTASRALAEEAIAAGAAGFVPKTQAARSMVAAVRFMAAGETYAPFGFMQQRSDAAAELLTAREIDVLRGIVRGQSNKEIARDHDLHEATVKLHAKTLCRKLGAKNRTQAAMIARDRNLA